MTVVCSAQANWTASVLSQAAVTVTNTLSNWATWSADTVRTQIDGFASEIWSTVGNLVQSFVPARPELRAPDASEQREAAMRSVIDEDTLRPAHEDQFFVQLPGEVDSQLASEYISAALSLAGGIETADEAGTDELHATLRRLYRERSADATLQERPRQQPASETLQFQEYRDSLANPDAWPRLSAAERNAAGGALPSWWPIQLGVLPGDSAYLQEMEKIGRRAKQKLLDVYAELEKLGTMATENPTGDDIVAISEQIEIVQMRHEQYVQELINIQYMVNRYYEATTFLAGTHVTVVIDKLQSLRPVVELNNVGLTPANMDEYNRAMAANIRAFSRLDGRTGTTITSLYVIDYTTTAVSLVIPIGGAAKVAFTEAAKSGGRRAGLLAAVKVIGTQSAITVGAAGATLVILPPVMRASGLQEHQVVAGLAVLQVFGRTRSLKYAGSAPKGSAFDLTIARGTKQQMLDAVRKLDGADATTKLSADDIAGLTENARLVAKKYWQLRGTARTAKSVQNQLDRPRWRFLDQAPEAKKIIQEIIDDFGG